MNIELETLKAKLLERKSWLVALNSLNEISLNEISLFEIIDPNYTVDLINANEIDYQELLLLLRGVQLTTPVNNAVPIGDLQGIQQIINTTENDTPNSSNLN